LQERRSPEIKGLYALLGQNWRAPIPAGGVPFWYFNTRV
jgi:hypothetical protein